MFHMVRNTLFSETDLVADLAERTRRSLPPDWSVRIDPGDGPRRPDFTLEFSGPDGRKGVMVVECKRYLEPKHVYDIVRQRRDHKSEPLLVFAPFLSQTARDRLVEAGISYADSTGNLRVVLNSPAIFLSTQGAAKDPNREKRPLQSLKGPAASDVVRSLCEWRPPYGVREFAQKAGVPPATVSRVADLLDRDGLIERDEKGRILQVDWDKLIHRWVEDYKVLGANEYRAYFEPRGMPSLIGKLRESKITYSVTGSLAASKIAPIAEPRLAMIYSDEPAKLAETLGLRANAANPNVILLLPKSKAVLQRTQEIDGINYVTTCQVAADLFHGPGRSPQESEALIDWMRKHEDVWRQSL